MAATCTSALPDEKRALRPCSHAGKSGCDVGAIMHLARCVVFAVRGGGGGAAP